MKLLRPIRKEDAASIAENANDKALWDNVRDYLPYPYTLKDGEEFVAYAMGKQSPEEFAIEVDGKAVGVIGFIPGRDVERLNAEIGYWIGKEYSGRGLVTEAVRELAEYIFSNTEIIRLFAGIFDFNIGSRRVLEKVGFRKVGTMSKAAIKNGQIIDMVYYELIKEVV